MCAIASCEEKEREREREREREADRQTDSQPDRQTDRQKDRQTEAEIEMGCLVCEFVSLVLNINHVTPLSLISFRSGFCETNKCMPR